MFAHHRDGVTSAQVARERGTGDVYFVLLLRGCLEGLAQGRNLFGGKRLQLVQALAQLALLLRSNSAKVVEQCGDFTLLA